MESLSELRRWSQRLTASNRNWRRIAAPIRSHRLTWPARDVEGDRRGCGCHLTAAKLMDGRFVCPWGDLNRSPISARQVQMRG